MNHKLKGIVLKHLIQIIFYLIGIGMGLSIIYYGIREYAREQNHNYDTSMELTSIKPIPKPLLNNDIILS